jgi:hypothetical protein
MTRASDIRKKLLKQRGVELKRLSRKPVPVSDLPVPFKKSDLMRLTELRFKDKIENLIKTGTIYELEKRLGVDASTISKWRKLIAESRNAEYFKQF